MPVETNSQPKIKNLRLAFAREYALLKWPVFPLHTPTEEGCSCHRPDCESVGKHPRTVNGPKDATTDGDTIGWWWEFEYLFANVGICTGKESGLVVLDEDPRHGGDETLRQLEAKYEPLPDTPTVLSGGGGRHFYFLHPGFYVRSGSNALGTGLDIKGDRGAIVAPPSLHASGGQYKWIEGRTPVVPVAPLPPWMLPLLRESYRSGIQGSAGSRGSWGIGEDGFIPQGQRHNYLERVA